MPDDPTNKPPAFDRISLRAVLVHEGEDATEALARAGFSDVISIPVLVGDNPHLSGGILGNGITPNLVAILETEQGDTFEDEPGMQPDPSRSASEEAAPPRGPVTTNLPAAFGIRPLAPVRKRGI
jgi:hypothetical protein